MHIAHCTLSTISCDVLFKFISDWKLKMFCFFTFSLSIFVLHLCVNVYCDHQLELFSTVYIRWLLKQFPIRRCEQYTKIVTSMNISIGTENSIMSNYLNIGQSESVNWDRESQTIKKNLPKIPKVFGMLCMWTKKWERADQKKKINFFFFRICNGTIQIKSGTQNTWLLHVKGEQNRNTLMDKRRTEPNQTMKWNCLDCAWLWQNQNSDWWMMFK